MKLGDFFTPEAGQSRRAWLDALDGRIDETLAYYLGPQLMPRVRGAVGAVQALSPGQDVVDAYTASGEVMQPGASAVDRAASGATLAAALMAMGMPGGVSSLRQGFDEVVDAGVRAYDPNTVNIFAGPRAKTADLAALDRAKSMAEAGASRDDIWSETGWFRGVDGNWRFEIDDSGAALTEYGQGAIDLARERSGRLDAVLWHDALFGAYPPERFGEATLSEATFPRGGYYPDTGAIVAHGPTGNEVSNTLLHEVQHAVQGVEGFTSGSSPGEMFVAHMSLARRAQHHSDAMALLQEVEANGGDWSRALQDYKEIGTPISEEGQALAKQFGNYSTARRAFEEIVSAKDKMEPLRRPGQWQDDAGFGPYYRTAGEVEARNVQARRGMTAEERRLTPPWKTQSVDDAAQLLVFGDRLQLAAPRPVSIGDWLSNNDTATLQEYLQ